MPTIPTNAMERALRKEYLQWLAGLSDQQDVATYLDKFESRSREVIEEMGGQVASYGALADFPVPKTLELSPTADVIYNNMKQAAISASITAGLNSKDAARQMLNAGLDTNYKRLERLARTETTNAYWKNAFDSVADLPAIVMVWGSEESPRTCAYCLARDGLVLANGSIRDHPNGRCTPIPTLISRLKYKGTLQPDGSVTMDPRFAPQKVKGSKAMESAGPTTAVQKDPLSGKTNPAAPSKATPPPTKTPTSYQKATTGQKIPDQATYLTKEQQLQNAKNAQLLKNAEKMYGKGSPKYLAAQKKLFPDAPQPSSIKKVAAKPPVSKPPVTKTVQPPGTGRKFQPHEDKELSHKGTPFTAKQKDALEYYTGRGYIPMNNTLRGKPESGATFAKSQISHLDAAMKKAVLPEDVAVLRAVNLDAFGGIDGLKKMVGGVFEEPGFLSTTLADQVAFNGAAVFDFTVPQGYKAIHMAPYSQYANERELLLNRGAKLAIESVKRSGSKWIVKATLVP